MRSQTMLALATAYCLTAPVPASAKVYLFQAQGTLGSPYSVDRNFNIISTPASTIGAGDKFSVTFRFNTDAAVVQSLFDADPTVNIYYGTMNHYRLSVGSYVSAPPALANHFASFQLWDGYGVGGVGAVDSFTFSTLNQLADGTSPVDHGPGVTNEIFSFNAFDFSATARTSDLISEITPLSGFGSQSGFLGYLNAGNFSQTVFQTNISSASLTALPEPSTWAMLLIGFGAIGAGLRRRPLYRHNRRAA